MLELRDEREKRLDLAERRELKFVLAGADIRKIRQLLECNTRRQVHKHSVSMVRSVYFDDVRLSACQANLNGLGVRRKLRVRWYDQLLPGREAFLEVKWRENRVTGKHRFRIHATQPLSELSYRQWRDALAEVVPTTLLRELMQFSEPIVVVEYAREHFVSDDGALRCTIDYDLAFYDQAGKPYISTRFAHRMRDFIVLEGKTPVGREGELKQLLYPLPLRAMRCSKYVHGCQMLGLIAGRN